MSSSHGKVLRLNADGTIPEDNHGVVVDGRGGAVLDEIHASGMRNPFRGRWDMESGLYLIGVVGGNNQDTAMEDIKSIVSGANYGWPHCEGPCGNPDFPTCSCAKYEPPLLSYPHHGEGKSLTGGVVYRGGAFPADPYDGAYFFADYVEGWVRYAHLVLPTAPGERPTLSNVTDFAEDVGPIVVLAEAPDGALWYANLWGNVRRFVYTDGSAAPVVSQPYVTEDNVAAAAAAPMGATVNVTWAVVATDADGDALTFEWYPGDGTGPLTTATPVLTHTYSTSGRYHAYVRVSDGVRAVRSVGSVLDVGPAPLVTLSSPTDGATFVAGQTLALRGSATHNGAPLDPALLTWHVLFQHDAHTHPAVTAATGGAHDLPIGTSGHSYTGRTAYAIKVTATAPGGVQSTATVTVWPAKVNVTVHTSPPGLPVEVDGLPHVTPYTEDTLANFTHAVCVQSVQCLNGRTMAFVGWQDDSTATAARIVRVPLVPTWAFTALYADHGPCGAPVTDGLAFYLRPDGLRRAEYDGNTIASWTDAADLSAPLTLGGGMPPTPMPGADSGLVVTEDVAMFRDGYLARTGLGALATGSADHTLVALLRYDGLGWGGFSFGRIGCLEVLGLGVTSQGYFLAESYCTSDEVQSGVLGTGSGWVVQTLVLRDGTWEHFVNGSRLEGGAAQWKVPTEGGSVILGADHGGGSTDLTVAEVLVYQRALAPAERMAVETYLTQTYLGGWTVEISSPIAGAELSGSTLAVTFAVAKASTSTTTSEPALAVQVDDLLPRLLTSDEQAARQVVVSLAATQLHHHIRLYAVQMDQETMLPGTLAEVEFLTDGTDNVKSSTQEVATSLETQSTTAASPPTSIVVTNTSDGTIVLQPTTWAADGRRVLQWTYATHIAASSFEWLVVLVDGTISGYVTSPEELTFTLPPLAPDHTATVTLALYLAEREPTFATLEVAGDEPPSSSATSTAPVQSTEATDSTSAALPEATPVVVDGLPWLNSIVGYSVRFASVPASGLDQSLHFHAAFNEPAAQLFGPVEARAAQCASLCDRNYHCRGIFVWLGEDGRERCLGLADVGLDRAAVTSLASASLIKVRNGQGAKGEKVGHRSVLW